MSDKHNIDLSTADPAELRRLAAIGLAHQQAEEARRAQEVASAARAEEEEARFQHVAEVAANRTARVILDAVKPAAIAEAVVETQRKADKKEEKKLQDKTKASLRKAVGFAVIGAYAAFVVSMAIDGWNSDEDDEETAA
jgi:hypothetical protein